MLDRNVILENLGEFLNSLICAKKGTVISSRAGSAENWLEVFQHPDLPFVLYYYPNDYQGHRHNHEISMSRYGIHLDENVWREKTEIVKNRLKSRLGLLSKIGARQTVVTRIDKAMAMQFQALHHLQFALPGKYRYGLFRNGELVAIAVFSGGRKMDGQKEDYRSFELIRFCHKKGVQVVGGLSKLLHAFQESFDPGDIMTYADKDWANISNYEALGFQAIGEAAPISKHFAENQDHANPVKWNSGSMKMVKRLK